jgi:hypothetical protein
MGVEESGNVSPSSTEAKHRLHLNANAKENIRQNECKIIDKRNQVRFRKTSPIKQLFATSFRALRQTVAKLQPLYVFTKERQITKVTNACSFSSGSGNGISIGNSGNNDFQPATEVAEAAGRIIALVFTFLPNPRICFEGRGGRERTNRKFYLDANAKENLLQNECKTNDKFRQDRFEKTGLPEDSSATSFRAVGQTVTKLPLLLVFSDLEHENWLKQSVSLLGSIGISGDGGSDSSSAFNNSSSALKDDVPGSLACESRDHVKKTQ